MTIDDLTRRAEEYLRKARVGAADRERDRELPHALVRELATAGLGSFRVPKQYGGPGATVRQVFEFIIALGAADSNIAQSVRPHFGFVESLIASPVEQERVRWFPRVLAGDLFGLANGEIGAPNGVIRTRVTRDGDGLRANGRKYYSTGTLFADWVSVSAVDDDEQRVSFVVPTDRPGLSLLDDWDGMGQRLTASGTTELTDVAVAPQDVVERQPAPGLRSLTTAFQQLFLAGVQAGIARNSLADAVWFAQQRSRPIKHSSATRSVEDPYIQHAVGEIGARAYAAEAAVLRAAEAIDRAWLAGEDPAPRTAAAVEVAQAQFLATESALKSAELIFDVGGGSATAREHNFDRHWRNARTVANHNPRYWKAAVVGAFLLNGTEPPTTGLF
ncbi:acyl-CoA dehydrogenase family protein [Dactylosporangium fulvum]|uniref:Dibenzothiophene monooxygenase n=1 Tax=Dactylosporangium fulvum TaxID=53359 RepID=A0ABY5WBD3_9ACTN|nr:acyl-CoA dehydrogenase family protein [Dactylosporangium fulvum]UWP86832.1 acyl-CoA dehydrogenase family protein [Dactylosporangium fulvum]